MKFGRKCIQALKPYVPGRSIAEVREQYHPPRIVKLGSNENPLGANPKVVEAIQGALTQVHLYPDGASRALRRALSGHYGMPMDWFMAGNGSDEVLLLIAAAFLNAGEKVLVSENTFSEYEFSGRIFDGEIVKVPQTAHRYDLSAFRQKLDGNTRLVFLCNPNNPTGSYFTHAELEALLEEASPQTLVVVDEAYAEFAVAGDFPDCLGLMRKFPNLIVCRTFSKLYALAALRLGYAIAHPDLLLEMGRVKSPFNVGSLAQVAGIAALEDKEFIRRSLEVNNEGRAYLESELHRLNLEFIPTQANFICFRTERPAVEFCEDLARRGIIIRPLKSFGLDEWSRVTIGTREQNDAFVEEAEKLLLG